MLIKRTKHDAIFSLLVRERARWTCERCARYFPEGDERRGFHCSHFVGRAVRTTRWHSQNARALCLGCHEYFTQRPLEHVAFMQLKIGIEGVDELRRLSNRIVRWRPPDLEEIYRHLKAERKRLLQAQNGGQLVEFRPGDFDFVGAEKFLTVTV